GLLAFDILRRLIDDDCPVIRHQFALGQFPRNTPHKKPAVTGWFLRSALVDMRGIEPPYIDTHDKINECLSA
ncbi:TPA: hypothetical protein ACNVAS_001053, partial [Citrobacter amalonaticus]